MTKKFTDTTLLVASHNEGKIKEIRALLEDLPVHVVGAKDYNLTEPEETGTTFEENALLKARYAVMKTGLVSLADDSGIEIDALDGAPGVYTADWAETPSGRDFKMAMTKTYTLLKDRPKPWTAKFVSTLALVWPDGYEAVVSGEVHGQLTWPMRGKMGFGYDPIFVPEGETRSFAELSKEEKNAISHRKRALDKLKAQCFAAT